MASGDTYSAAVAADFKGVTSTPATPDTVDHGTGQPVRVLDFDSAQTEAAMTAYPLLMPGQYDGTTALDVVVTGAMDSANTGTKGVRLDIKISRVTGDLGADGFATAQSVTATVNNTADTIFTATVAFTNAQFDGVQPSEWFLVHIQRDHDHAGDDATGDFQFVGLEVQEQ